jgi:hypothetical protein
MANPKLIITGWPRGGLGYVARLLQLAKAEVGQTFDENTNYLNFNERLQQAKEIEISPFLVPWLDRDEFKNARVVFVTRDPMRILNSFYFNGFFTKNKKSAVEQVAYRSFVNFESLYKDKPIQASASYIYTWYAWAISNCSSLDKFPVEKGPRHLLDFFLSWGKKAVPFCPPVINSSNCQQTLLPSQLQDPEKSLLMQLMASLGYYQKYWFPRGGHAHYTAADWHC